MSRLLMALRSYRQAPPQPLGEADMREIEAEAHRLEEARKALERVLERDETERR